MGHKFENILQTVGNTPVVRIGKLAPAGINLFVKIEAFNPMGSVKDRLALGVIEDAEKSGALKPGQTVIEATSGNTGIGLAMVCAQKGYPLVVTMAESFSVERRKLMRFLGAKVVLTPAPAKGTGMVAKAQELAKANGWFLTSQFENESNPDAHSRTTAREIIRQLPGRIDAVVSGYGTGGTLNGVGNGLREVYPDIRVVAMEPAEAAMLQGEAPCCHAIEGVSGGYLPPLLDGVVIDRAEKVSSTDAIEMTQRLACDFGLLVGISAGANVVAALRTADSLPAGARVVTFLCDRAERYYSTRLFHTPPAAVAVAAAAACAG